MIGLTYRDKDGDKFTVIGRKRGLCVCVWDEWLIEPYRGCTFEETESWVKEQELMFQSAFNEFYGKITKH